MAVWNNQVRGNVIAIKANMGWDPTEIVNETNPMPSMPDNINGMGKFPPLETGGQHVMSRNEQSLNHIEGDPRRDEDGTYPKERGKNNPFPGMGSF